MLGKFASAIDALVKAEERKQRAKAPARVQNSENEPRAERPEPEAVDEVEEASRESFPASDAPAFTP